MDEEYQGREEAVDAQLHVFRAMLPIWLKQLSTLSDPRQAKKIKHKLSVVLLFGLLCFVFQMSSRRQANGQMSKPCFRETLQSLFPELESMPHADTLGRVLENMDADALPAAHLALIKRFVRGKKFQSYLIQNCHPISIDGTQKLVRDGQWWAEEWLDRSGATWSQQYVYILEANLVFHNGMTLPLFSEFLSHAEGDTDTTKQEFPQLPLMILLDGLYASGPIFDLCIENDWDSMIVLKDKCLPSLWEEYRTLKNLNPLQYQGTWRVRRQQISWVNAISYAFKGADGKQKVLAVHVVVCEEEWEEVNSDTAEIETKTSRHTWISGKPITAQNVHERCNLGARFRWGIEVSHQTEKRGGYCYEHLFSHNWQALCGFHHLLRLAHLVHAITFATPRAAKFIRAMGLREFLNFVKGTFTGPWLRKEWVAQFLAQPFHLQLE